MQHDRTSVAQHTHKKQIATNIKKRPSYLEELLQLGGAVYHCLSITLACSRTLEPVRCIFVHVYFPHLLGGFLHILTCTCNYMLWPLALREYNKSIPNMVSEPVLGLCS
jgi:hypothetical protein